MNYYSNHTFYIWTTLFKHSCQSLKIKLDKVRTPKYKENLSTVFFKESYFFIRNEKVPV